MLTNLEHGLTALKMRTLGLEKSELRAPGTTSTPSKSIDSESGSYREPAKIMASDLVKVFGRSEHEVLPRPRFNSEGPTVHSTRLTSQNRPDIAQMVKDAQRELVKEKNAELGKMRAQWRQEVEELAERERKLKQRELELTAENVHLILARQERERAGKDPLETRLYGMNADIWAFSQRVRKMEELNRFTHPDIEAERSFESEKIDDAMDHMGSELESITIIHRPTINQSLASDSDLGSLVRTVSDDGVGRGGETQWLRKCLSKFHPELVVKTLVLGAVRDWVFGAKYPDFTPMDMRLLGAYREVVIGYGKNASWNIVNTLTSFRWLG